VNPKSLIHSELLGGFRCALSFFEDLESWKPLIMTVAPELAAEITGFIGF
jgi:hypothetical protein